MIQNAGFEQPNGPDEAVARHWAVTAQGGGEQTVDFEGNNNTQLSAYESFERGWALDGNPQLFITDLDEDADDLDHLPIETMSFWSLNQVVMTLGALEAASFNEQSTTYETFFEWESNMIDADFSLAASELESLATETFAWAVVGSGMMGSIGGATFNSSGDLREMFVVREPQIVHVQSQKFRTTGGSVAYVGAQDDVVSFRTTGELPEEVAEDVPYYVYLVEHNFITISRAPRNSNGIALVINDSGNGVHRIVGDPEKYWIDVMP